MKALLLLTLSVLAMACTEEPVGGRVIYLNRGGATVTPGSDDAARGVSSIVDATATIPAATMSDASWRQVVSCVQRAYAPFDVKIVDARPSDGAFTMALFGGNGSELGLGPDQHGKAPFACDTVDNAIAFVFTDNLDNDVARACETAVHELAHTFSVDHLLLASAPTSYLSFSGTRHFQDVDAACGETEARACECGGTTQNAFATLSDRLGLAADLDVEPPTVEVSATMGARGSFSVKVHAVDGSGIGTVTLHYADGGQAFTSTCGDGRVSCSSFGNDFTFVVPGASGQATFHAEVLDMLGNQTVSNAQQVN